MDAAKAFDEGFTDVGDDRGGAIGAESEDQGSDSSFGCGGVVTESELL